MSKQTLVLNVNAQFPEPPVIAQAASVLRYGGLVAFPTETVYGLGANALDVDAIQGLFDAKARPANDPLIVHLADTTALSSIITDISPLVETLAENFWPGPLTLVLPKSANVPLSITAGGPTVAVRIPAHPVAQALIRAAGVPVAAPSANRFGHVSPTCAQHVLVDLEGRIDLILDSGSTTVGVESTVLSLLTTPPTILRPGGVSREALGAVLGKVQVAAPVVAHEKTAPAPGMTLQHYAPCAMVTLYCGSHTAMLKAMQEAISHLSALGKQIGVLVSDEDAAIFKTLPVVIQPLGPEQQLPVIASSLFAGLRALDIAEVDIILARDFGDVELGLAIRDRLTRAAAGRVVYV